MVKTEYEKLLKRVQSNLSEEKIKKLLITINGFRMDSKSLSLASDEVRP